MDEDDVAFETKVCSGCNMEKCHGDSKTHGHAEPKKVECDDCNGKGQRFNPDCPDVPDDCPRCSEGKKERLEKITRDSSFDQLALVEFHVLKHMESTPGVKRLADLLIKTHDSARLRALGAAREAVEKTIDVKREKIYRWTVVSAWNTCKMRAVAAISQLMDKGEV